MDIGEKGCFAFNKPYKAKRVASKGVAAQTLCVHQSHRHESTGDNFRSKGADMDQLRFVSK